MSVGRQFTPACAATGCSPALAGGEPPRPIGPGFAAAYALAQIAAYLSFLPLLQIVLPLRAAAIDPAHKAALLSHLMIYGALTAGFAHLLAGALSDRTLSTFGRRRPWIVSGLGGMTLAYAVIARAATPGGLMTGLIMFQITFNMFFAALGAIIADRVPERQRGSMSALLSLGYPLGNLAGTVLADGHLVPVWARLPVLGMAVIALAAPLVLCLREPASERRGGLARQWLALPVVTANLAFAFTARLLTSTALTLVHTYLLYDLASRNGSGTWLPAGLRPEQALAQLIASSTVVYIVAALACGRLSDLTARHRRFVIGAALTLSVTIAGLALAPRWSMLLIVYLGFGGATGCYHAVENALIIRILPSRADAGRDLGLINLSNILPQVLSPMLALACIRHGQDPYQMLLFAGAGLALGGAALTALIRNVG